MRSLFLCAGLLLLSFASGCTTSTAARLEAPAVRVTGFASETGILSLRFVNPNNVPVVVGKSIHTLYLGGEHIGGLRDAQPIGMPAVGETDHTVTLSPAYAQIARDYLAKNPGRVRATVESKLIVTLENDDTVTLKSSGGGLVGAR